MQLHLSRDTRWWLMVVRWRSKMAQLQIDPSSVFVVSGGAKGITAECVIKLAQSYPCRWILLGRSKAGVEPAWAKDLSETELKQQMIKVLEGETTPMQVQRGLEKMLSSREIQKTLQAIEETGSRAEYISVDVCDAIALQQKLAAAVGNGTITGIIHGAGNLADKRIENKTEADFEKVYSAKVKGLENLLACVASQLDYLILFSSVAGFYGNAGQTDYAIANEILNKSAHLIKQYTPKCHVVAINWGPWDSGMVTPQLKKVFAERNISLIPLEVGAQMLVDETTAIDQPTQVVIGSPIVPTPEELNHRLQNYRIRRQLSLEANPFLQAYGVSDRPVLPVAFAASWIINTCEQLYPGYRFFRLNNFQVLQEIVLDSPLNEYILDVELAKTDAGEIVFECLIQSEQKRSRYYRAQVTIQNQIPPAPINSLLRIPNQGQKKSLSSETILNIDLAKLSLQAIAPQITPLQQGQFPIQTFNPYVVEALFQSISVWVRKFYQADCFPANVQHLEQFSPIASGESYSITGEIKSHTHTHAIAELTAHNEQGEIYVRALNVKVNIH